MQLIKCTAKLRKEMGLKESDLADGCFEDMRLGPWHANLIHINSKKCVLFVNDKTLFNFIVPDVSRTQIRDLLQLFLFLLYPVLAEEGFTKSEREEIASEYSKVEYSKSTSKSVLGSMNDLAYHYKHRILFAGGIYSPEVPGIIKELNRIPMGALKYDFPVEELRRAVRGNE